MVQSTRFVSLNLPDGDTGASREICVSEASGAEPADSPRRLVPEAFTIAADEFLSPRIA